MSTLVRALETRPPRGEMLPRLLAGVESSGAGPVSLADHLARWGALDLRHAADGLSVEVDAAGLVGHGGAWFPVAAKWRSVRSRGLRRPVVVANGAEGEPGSLKDALLLARLPHLVLDGAAAAAAALGATRVVAYVPGPLVPGVEHAVEARRRHGLDPVPVEVVDAPRAFLSGQETAVVNALDGRRDAVPSFVGLQSIRERGVGGRPTLVQNVETLADAALVARFGAPWFRSLGTDRFPGTMLLTVTGRYEEPTVVEAAIGTPFRDVLGLSLESARGYRGALLGGYGGGWVSMPTLLDLDLTETSARLHGSSLGAGVVALVPRSVCPLAEMARVVRYMEQQGARQCGPCVNGLAALADAVEALAFRPKTLRGRVDPVLELCSLVEGRGACRHPDGVSRFVLSGCSVFDDEVASHLGHGPCHLTRAGAVLPVPGARPVLRRTKERDR